MRPASAAMPAPAAYYGKLGKMDAEEARHVKAQFLIHKVLEEATSSSSSTTTTAIRSRRPPPPALVRVKAIRIGVRLKKLRLAIQGVRRHLRNLRRLIAHGGGGRRSSSVKPAGPHS
ncbi:hypothetical protein BDA96_02G334300 [Sorghum bicolor]|uniref:Uncharacterized protein n=1 Tax=Sorghum bicolor TaxID=4558 RepID=A0A921RSW0_SORBI|nr:hypothetical protein BDA96_02G334300 [Sorghum bicolor]